MSSLSDFKITDGDLAAKGVVAAPDKLTGTTAQNKAIFDRLIGEVVKVKYNAMLAALESDISDYLGQSEQERRAAEETRVLNEQERVSNENARNVWEDYDASKTYQPGNKVAYNGSSYVCILQGAGAAPTDTAHWRLIARKGLDGAVASFNGRTGAVAPLAADYAAFFAPTGFGLGNNGRNGLGSEIADCDGVVATGWYSCTDGTTANIPALLGYGRGCLHVIVGRTVVQIYYGYNFYGTGAFAETTGIAIRHSYGNPMAWGPWEYVNPPLAANQEYRTTERWLGKPVYVKLVTGTAGAQQTSKDFAYGNEYTRPVRARGRINAGANSRAIPNAVSGAGEVRLGLTYNCASVWTAGNFEGMAVELVVYYTKTTD